MSRHALEQLALLVTCWLAMSGCIVSIANAISALPLVASVLLLPVYAASGAGGVVIGIQLRGAWGRKLYANLTSTLKRAH